MIKLIALGRVMKDAEVLQSKAGKDYAKFAVSVSKKVNGEWQSQWLNCMLFGNAATKLGPYIQKGQKCYVEGEPKASGWVGKDGQVKSEFTLMVQDIQILHEPVEKQSVQPEPAQTATFSNTPSTVTSFTEDDIPF